MERIPLSEAAASLGITARTLRHQIASGRFAAERIGSQWVTTHEEVERYRAESLGRKGRHAADSSARSS